MIYSIKSWFHNNKRSFNAILSKKIPSPKAIGLGNFVSFYDFRILLLRNLRSGLASFLKNGLSCC